MLGSGSEPPSLPIYQESARAEAVRKSTENYMENDFSLPDEINYDVLKVQENSSSLVPSVQTSQNLFVQRKQIQRGDLVSISQQQHQMKQLLVGAS